MTGVAESAPERGAAEARRLTDSLADPFHPDDVKFKPQVIKNNRCLAIAYVDARLIQDRLDEVLGPENWQDSYRLLPDRSVICRLRLNLAGRWVTKMDVGSPSEQPDGGDQLKAAFSDALKRAAVKFGIGRYLYRLESQWVAYDPQSKQIAQRPKLPEFALPAALRGAAKAAAPRTPGAVEKPPAAKADSAAEKAAALPGSGAELHRRLRDRDTQLSRQGRCGLGALLAHVTQAGVKAGYGADIDAWEGDAIRLAVEQTRQFLHRIQERSAKAVA